MIPNTHRALVTGALANMTGQVSNGSTWVEDIIMSENGLPITDATTMTWELNFRVDYQSANDLSLSTTDSTLTVTQGATETTITINAPDTSLTQMEGEYLGDLISENVAGRRFHWAHGVVTFINEPVWSS